MRARPAGSAHGGQGRRLRRTLVVSFASACAVAAVVIPLAVHAGSDEDVDVPDPGAVPSATEGTEADAAVRFGRFPLDQGWAGTYGQNAIDGPDVGAGGISMPEGHCDEEVLFRSGYQDKLSAYVSTEELSRTREILGYADARAARSTFRALGQAVARCPTFGDLPRGKATNTARVFDSIDEANARTGTTTFTFAYTSTGSTPFGVLYQFAVVDDVLYGSNVYGAWTRKRAAEGVAALDEENASLISLMSRIER